MERRLRHFTKVGDMKAVKPMRDFTIISLYGNRNQNYAMMWHATNLLERLKYKPLTMPSSTKFVEQMELLCIVGEYAKWHSHPGKQLGTFL